MPSSKNMKPADLGKLLRTTEEIYSLEELQKKLALGKPLRIKYGVDVTAPFLHIGHAVNLWMMRMLQECGHKVVFLIGDFTTRIGDPTGKSETRKIISQKEIDKNAKDFIEQVGQILLTDKKVFEVRRNSEWYGKMDIGDFLPLLSLVTHAKLIQRDMFQKRISEGREIYMHEMIYPILQGYDSVMLRSDLTIVGSDQLFNELMGRFYQEKFGQGPQIVMTTKITPGLDGKEKQSKSLGNYIALDDAPSEKFGKIMSMPDALIIPYFNVYTEVPVKDIDGVAKELLQGTLHPMDAKKRLGKALVERYHGAREAQKAEEAFVNIFQKKEAPRDMQEYTVAGDQTTVITLLMGTGGVSSKNEAKRLIEQGGVELDGKVITDPRKVINIEDGAILRVGKKLFFRLRTPK